MYAYDVGSCFKTRIDNIVLEAAAILRVPAGDLRSSLSEYNPLKGDDRTVKTHLKHTSQICKKRKLDGLSPSYFI
jgi:hypothetical protein